MNRERLMIYSRLINGTMSMQNYVIGPDGGWHDSEVTRLLTSAINQALEEAARACQQEGDEWDSDAVQTQKNYAYACRDRVRALKLPEE